MKKLVKWLSTIICAIVLSTSMVYAERFDFAEHKYEFIDGDGVITECKYDDEEPAKHWVIIFKDGCTVEFITNLDDTESRCWRWTHRRLHGKKT